MSRQPFGRRINAWLAEAPGEQFTDNKWKFWFLTLCGFQILNAVLTAAVFSAGGQLQNAMGAVLLAVGALLGWLGVAFMHYSDSTDRSLARGVSLLDSITLICVLAHFTFLLWTFGHLRTLQADEARYELAAATYNAKAEKVSDDNVRIAASAEHIATETTKAERLRNDTAYQQRKAAEAGRGIALPRRQTPAVSGPALSTSAVELEKPEKPPESSTRFLTRWDSWIRLANYGELLLAVLTLIFIRNRSAMTNSPAGILHSMESIFPTGRYRSPVAAPVGNLTTKKGTTKEHVPFDSEGLKRLREALRDISFRLAGLSFKAVVRGDALWILMVKANAGTQETIASAKARLTILTDALTMSRNAYRDRVERFLIQNGFDLGGHHEH